MSKSLNRLSRRERQIMELIYQKGRATVADIRQAMPDNLNYSSVRALMGILEGKGFLRHIKDGRAYVYSPTVDHKEASRAALKQVVNTFFDGSVENVVAALISSKSANLSSDEYDRLGKLLKSKQKKDNKK